MKIELKFLHIVYFFIVLILATFVSNFFKHKEIELLKVYGLLTNGEVLKVSRGTNKNRHNDIKFFYTVNREKKWAYKTNIKTLSKYVENLLIGKIFPVIYSQENPNICRMLISKEDFAVFGLPYPDSLLKYSKIDFTKLK